MYIKMLSLLFSLLVTLYSTKSQTLYSSAMDNCPSELFTMEAIQSNIETQIKKILKREMSSSKDMCTKSCPFNWTPFRSSCYYIREQEKSWDNAAMECQYYGAKLVEIETKDENDFLKQRLSIYDEYLLKQNSSDYKKFWIGGTDKIIEGKFVWASTGSSLTFKDWDRLEPNDQEGIEDCMEISRFPRRIRLWNDANCALKFYFICEKSC
ncbi:CD209 antigen-like protein C isoform X2 [Saccostrea cucullata]|uniref:CD209 antigen-like protein C isoform X2 n=1 Tax=Saccostrea cuccullata TaxID=36930 RepID=UPI002ED5ED94